MLCVELDQKSSNNTVFVVFSQKLFRCNTRKLAAAMPWKMAAMACSVIRVGTYSDPELSLFEVTYLQVVRYVVYSIREPQGDTCSRAISSLRSALCKGALWTLSSSVGTCVCLPFGTNS